MTLRWEWISRRRPITPDITLTQSGHEHLERTWQHFQVDISAAFADLTADQQQQLLAITPVLTGLLRKHTAATIARGR